MTRANRTLAVLAILAVALVALVLWSGRREYLAAPHALASIEPARVTRVELSIPPLAAQVFERRGDTWWRTAPAPAAQAVAARVERLANLAATPVARWLPDGKVDPAKVGLDPPSATLTLDGTRLEYGGLTAIDDLRYVRVGGRVALVPRQYSPEVVLTKPAQP